MTDLAAAVQAYRPELVAHCYRMLGSVHDAEDVVQETFVRAWRSLEGFEGRSSLRRWLYTIATNVCLTTVRRAQRPTGIVEWLEPYVDPVETRQSVRLAFVAALQHLPARQRAALLLCDVLAWSAADAAGALDMTVGAVTSALQRARASLRRLDLVEDDLREPADRVLLDRYAAAFERADVAALAALLHAEVTLEMPPGTLWFDGRTAVLGFLAERVLTRPWRMRVIRANGQPALLSYDGDEPHRLHVLGVRAGLISSVVAFPR